MMGWSQRSLQPLWIWDHGLCAPQRCQCRHALSHNVYLDHLGVSGSHTAPGGIGGEQRGAQPGTQEQGLVPAGLGGFQGASGEGAEQRGPSEMGAELLSLLQPLDAGLYFSKVVLYNSQVLLHCLLDLRGWG